MSTFQRTDDRFFKLALEMAKRGVGQTGPNPSVGCVIVKDGRIIGRGVTGKNGAPHAETRAINQAGSFCNGSTMFVTLEPCAHFGRTPPCVESIINAGILRVVCPLVDPDPRVSGTGFKKLSKAGIQIDMMPNAKSAARAITRGFINRLTKGRPFVTVKLGMSLDGKIASSKGKSRWITNEHARNRSHLLRAQNDAVLVGTKTFLEDNPTLNIRGTLKDLNNPLRIFLDRNLRVFPSARVVENLTRHPSIIVYGEDPDVENLKIWKIAGVELLEVDSSDGNLSLDKLFQVLGQRGINSLLVEGGGQLVKSLLNNYLVDELVVYRSGLIIGSDGIPSIFKFESISGEIDTYPKMKLQSVKQYGDNIETVWNCN